MLNKNVRLEIMYKRGFRPSHAVWIDTYNKQFGRVSSTPFKPE